MTGVLLWLEVAWSNLVFWFKRRAGFRRLEYVSGLTGIVASLEIAEDGDTCFDLVPGERHELLTYRTVGSVHLCKKLHCEIVPKDRARLAAQIALLSIGARVTVSGYRSWDGCHHGRGVIFDGLMVLLGAAPVLDGWLEIHPCTSLEVIV